MGGDSGYDEIYNFFNGRTVALTGNLFPKILNLRIAAFQGKGNCVGNLIPDFELGDIFS